MGRRSRRSRRSRRRGLTLAVALAVALPLAAGAAACGEASEADPGRRTLAVRPAPGAEAAVAPLEESWIFRRSRERFADRWRVVVAPEAAGEAEVVLSPLPAPPAVRARFAALPIALDRAPLVFAGTEYPHPTTAVAARLPGDEERWLVAGTDPRALAGLGAAVVGRVLGAFDAEDDDAWRSADFVVRESRWIERLGRWRRASPGAAASAGNGANGDGGGALEVDPQSDVDGFREREERLAALRSVGGERGDEVVRLLAPPARVAALAPLAIELEREVVAMLGRLREGTADGPAARAPSAPLVVVVEPDHVAQVENAGRLALAAAGGAADVHWVEHPDDAWALRHALAGRLLERAGLAARSAAAAPLPWLDAGAALRLADGDWYGRPWRDWLPRLAAAGALPAAEELLAAERQADGSEPLWVPVAAAVVDARDGATLAERLARPFELGEVAAVLERLARAASGMPAPFRQRRPALPADRFLAGVSLAMTNTLEGGYHAPRVGEALDDLAGKLGADAVALMPFAYQRHPHEPGLSFMNRSPTSETDAGTLHAARAADARGFTVLWKPHLWISFDSWPGEIEMPDEAAWAAWWRSYRRYVLHHALLADYAGAEIFAVGVELERTVERPEWAALVLDVRRLYGGALTYAANWGRGAERFAHWHLLDYVGVDAYYPLAAGEDAARAGDRRLAEGAREVVGRLVALADAAGKPLLLTEVGFPARRAAWVEPHAEGRSEEEFAPEDQARAYRALLGALAGDDRPAVAGAFVWKAFSGPRPWDAPRDPDFRFLGRPAEREIARFFAATGPPATPPASP